MADSRMADHRMTDSKKTKQTKVKICGLTRMEDIDALNRYRPDFAGFVFAPSRRQVSEELAMELRARLSAEILVVGVFVNAPVEQIECLVAGKVIDMVQLHGTETPCDLEKLRMHLGRKVPLIKAVRMSTETDLGIWDQSEADYLLLDAVNAGAGKTFDHNLIDSHLPIQKPWFLAGGMNPENAAAAIARFSPFGVDVSSGVETDGKKDPQKIRRMIAAVRSHSSNSVI
ncbi:phosphoribosylanthranilate isomerase [Brotaphodocola sp.]|uniref:phosphoribosylanthranilate isomerase n=1 Tax=Brotaphodocola sp. TaxID=3073577 RepID=UPI003D7D760F